MTTEKSEELTTTFTLTMDEVAMLWQLLNTQGTGVPFAVSNIAARLFDKIRDTARAHGIVKA